jgi:hypothetical protein
MFPVKKVLFERNYKAGYIYRRELIDDSEWGGTGELEMVRCYTPKGDYIGNAREARYLCVKRGLTNLQKTHHTHCVCSIGFIQEPHPQGVGIAQATQECDEHKAP